MRDWRGESIATLTERVQTFDVVVIGGGANGAGIALDAGSRGLKVALFERADFGSGTSSRSSKLIHGGIRYLKLFQFGLVRDALDERACLLRNAPALVKPLGFLLPAYSRRELLLYRSGLKLYDLFAGRNNLARSQVLQPGAARALVPELSGAGLVGAVRYADACFDDVRLLQAILHAASDAGAMSINYAEVVALERNRRGRIGVVTVCDRRSGATFDVRAAVVINATGVYGDAVRGLAQPTPSARIQWSQGAHVVVPRHFLGGDRALVLPRVPDGRIMFALPWHGHVLLGTTDTPVRQLSEPPVPAAHEIDMILEVAGQHLMDTPRRADVRAVFAGVRPLAHVPGNAHTARISREHAIDIDASGLVSVSGGKWTTYRQVAMECVSAAVRSARLSCGPCVTHNRKIAVASADDLPRIDVAGFPRAGLASVLVEQPWLAARLHPALPYCGAHFVWAARAEMALTVADALAYRTRALFIDAQAAAAIAAPVAAIMAAELRQDARWVVDEIAAARKIAADFALTPIPARETPG